MPPRDEPLGHRAMTIEPLATESTDRTAPPTVGPLVPIEPEPAQAVENPFDHLRRRSLDVGVLDAQHEHAAVTTREQPVEERRARAADVEVAGRRRSEANSGSRHLGW